MDYLNQGASAAPIHHVGEFLKSGKLIQPVDQLVFREKPSTVTDANGHRIEDWTDA